LAGVHETIARKIFVRTIAQCDHPANYPNYREILGIGRPYLPAEAGALNEDCRYRVRALDRVIVILRLLNQQMG
jgi:hypothetical protein